MAYRKNNGKGEDVQYSHGSTTRKSVNTGEKAIQKFTDMFITRMESMKASDWKQGWVNPGNQIFGMPQNMSGRNYSGSNLFLLELDTSMNGFKVPVYLTFLQAMKENIRIKKGSEAMPVIYWDLNIRDANGHRMSEADYRSLTSAEQKKCDVHPFLRAFNVFNIDQTNLEEVNKEKYDKLVAKFQQPIVQLRDRSGMYENAALDRMFERDEWLCRIQTSKLVDGAFYSPARDLVVVPMKEQFNIGKTPEDVFKDGMEYYSSALHEMAHSTGAKSRLNREGGRFGDKKYAKEELVAEITAAMVGNSMGFDKRILNNNAAYVDGWIKVLKEDPKFIVSVMADVNKASKMILEEVDKQKLALGEQPILAVHETAMAEAAQQKKMPENLSVVVNKDNRGNYYSSVSVNGQPLSEPKQIPSELGFRCTNPVSSKSERMRIQSDVVRKYYSKELDSLYSGRLRLSQTRQQSASLKR